MTVVAEIIEGLPDGWEVLKLGDAYEFSKKPRSLEIRDKDMVPFIPMDSISEGSKSVKGWQMKKMSEVTSGTFVLKNDLMIAKITPSFENGKQAILDNLPQDYGYATTEVWAIHPKNNHYLSDYLFNYIRIPEVRHSMATKMEGATGRQRLPRNVLESQPIAFPPFDEQKKIASVLLVLQEAKEKTENVLSALRELKKSMMKHLFTYGAVSIEEIGSVKLKETEIGLMPEKWDVVDLGAYCNFTTGKLNSNQSVLDGLYPFFTCSPQTLRIDKYSFDCEAVLLAGNNARGVYSVKHYKGKFDAYQRTYVITIKDVEQFDYLYLKNVIETKLEELRIGSIGTSTKFLTLKMLLNLRVPMPNVEEQKHIADTISAINSKIEAEGNKKNSLDALFKTLLSLLMTGKMRVNHLEI